MLDNVSYVWFAKLIVAGEVLVRIALIIGAFVGVAAFFAALLNGNFIMAGLDSSNGLHLVGAIVLILAWEIAGYDGFDRFLLSRLGTPEKAHLRTPQGKEPTDSSSTSSRE